MRPTKDGGNVRKSEKAGRTAAVGHQDGREPLRERAKTIIEELGLAGYDNASILQVDAWLDSPACRKLLAEDATSLSAVAISVGAYLGEAIVGRHGGKWDFTGDRPVIVFKRAGFAMVDPIGKVLKRIANGPEDNLLGIVNLTDHVVNEPARARAARALDLASPLHRPGSHEAPSRLERRGLLRLLAILVVAVVLVAVLTALGMWIVRIV